MCCGGLSPPHSLLSSRNPLHREVEIVVYVRESRFKFFSGEVDGVAAAQLDNAVLPKCANHFVEGRDVVYDVKRVGVERKKIKCPP